MQSAENRNATLCRADLPITKRLPQKYRVQTVTRRDEVIRPYGSNPDKSHRRFPIHPTGTRCRALICAEIEREANPKRRRSAPDDRAVLIAALVFSCEAALSSQRKIRGSRKRGYKKPQVSCTPFCPSPREGRVPARRSVRNPRRRRRPKRHSPSEGETPPSPGLGPSLASCVRPQNRRIVPALPWRERRVICGTHIPSGRFSATYRPPWKTAR